ncbi:hypothetical protein [Microbacterium sp. JB110]|uniref:hypothetical protein n=1 Tax=Microbacterium sp. JB110 TaxID=2024477 RepID=UPI000B35A9AB|nr:hypothetical protein [Microbacterium sp. JB110]RCS60080.1 hypothetical protein CIK77_11790 [Microbacterium sp. JB110]
MSSTLVLLAACDSQEEPSGLDSESVQIAGDVTVWTYPLPGTQDPEWWKPHIARFNETGLLHG